MYDVSDANPHADFSLHYEGESSGRQFFDLSRIRERLRESASIWVPELFPAGKITPDRRQLRVGDLDGNAATKDGSTLIDFYGEFAGRATDFASGESCELIDLIGRRTGLDGYALYEHCARIVGEMATKQKVARAAPAAAIAPTDKGARALEIAAEAAPWPGTQADRYLKEARGLCARPGEDIRFHPSLYDGETKARYPGLVAIFRDAAGNQLPAIHRIFLSDGGARKADTAKKTLGSSGSGGSIRLLPIGPDRRLGIAEGIETALAAAQISHIPTWAAISTSGLRRFEWPTEIRELIIFADAGKPGEDAAAALSARALSSGIRCRVFHPINGDDFADDLAKGARWADYHEADTSSSATARPAEKKAARQAITLSRRAHWLADGVKGADDITLISCVANVAMILRGDPAFDGRITFDEFAKRVVCWNLPWNEAHEPREWTDTDDIFLAEYCQLAGVPAGPATCSHATQAVAHEFPSHPPRDWLESLQWDGTPRLDTVPTRYLGAKSHKLTSAYFRLFSISAVARVLQPGCKADAMIVLEGEQDSGKSEFLRQLVPTPEWFSDDIGGRIGDKDSALALQGKLIVELSELSALRGSTPNEIKSWVSRQVDRVREPYGRRAMDIPRSNVFAATTNETEYLQDSTGNRRFWPIRCKKISLVDLSEERDQLWAEAVHLYRSGAKWWLPDELRIDAKADQQMRRDLDPWQDMIATFVERQLSAGRDITTARIMSNECLDIRTDLQTRKAQQRIVAILNELGFEKKQVRIEGDRNGRRKKVYVFKGDASPQFFSKG